MDEMDQNIHVDETAELLAAHIYDRTAASRVTGKKEILLHPPAGPEKEILAPLLATIKTEAAHPALTNIDTADGKKDVYCYDGRIMTPQYAKIDALLADKDILATIASVTRTDSKTYPRPTPFEKLLRTPFGFSKDELLGAIARMKQDEAYQDIGVVTASNGKSALFSSLHISERYARALYEQEEVLDRENP